MCPKATVNLLEAPRLLSNVKTNFCGLLRKTELYHFSILGDVDSGDEGFPHYNQIYRRRESKHAQQSRYETPL